VYRAYLASGGITQHQICNRLEKTHNQASERASIAILYRLCLLGLLSKKKEGKAIIYRVTLAGTNYLHYFERTLRDVRQKF
jgi:predicted transcriptional regulator